MVFTQKDYFLYSNKNPIAKSKRTLYNYKKRERLVALNKLPEKKRKKKLF